MPSGFTRWPWWRRWFGRKAERTAAAFFRRDGYRIIAANVDDLRGELDLIAVKDQTVIVIEVRSSESRSVDELAGTVDLAKQKRITAATVRFLQRKRWLGVTVRFDVLAIRWPADAPPEFHHLPDAFPAVGDTSMF
jgi:putative endonuclease